MRYFPLSGERVTQPVTLVPLTERNPPKTPTFANSKLRGIYRSWGKALVADIKHHHHHHHLIQALISNCKTLHRPSTCQQPSRCCCLRHVSSPAAAAAWDMSAAQLLPLPETCQQPSCCCCLRHVRVFCCIIPLDMYLMPYLKYTFFITSDRSQFLRKIKGTVEEYQQHSYSKILKSCFGPKINDLIFLQYFVKII